MEEHSGIVKEVLKILSNNKLSIQTKKCHFHQTKIDYLGVIISKNSVEVDLIKIKGVAEWPEPKEKQEVWQFLGFCNFYRHFIQGFAKVTKPLTELTGKMEWKWGMEERSAFEKLKKLMTSTPVLAIPNADYKLCMEVDASGYAIGGVLSQQQSDESWRPISFISQSLSETERNYKIYNWELLAVMTGLRQWHPYLMGTKQVEVWTDHENLEYFRQPQKLNRRQAQWLSVRGHLGLCLVSSEGLFY